MASVFLIVAISYLVGSFPTSIILARITRQIDIRNFGSGNAGGTNAFRVLGWKSGLFVALVDLGKGAFTTLVISEIRVDEVVLNHETIQIIAGISAVIGHIWTIMAKLKGGKGVATAGGMVIALHPWAALACVVVFFIAVALSRYVSVGSITAAASLPLNLLILSKFFDKPVTNTFLFSSVMIGSLIIFTHRENIRRLLDGKENRFGKSDLAPKPEDIRHAG